MIDHLSYSSITLFLDCAEAWRRKYVAGEKTVATPALVFGSAFHGAVEELVTHKDLSKTVPAWSTAWNKAIEQPVDWELDTPEEHYNEGVRMLTAPVVQETLLGIMPGQDADGVQIERKVELRVPGVPVPVIGYIDSILSDGTPADFKTSARSWSDDKAQDSLQSLFYLAALNQAGVKINWQFQHIVFVKTKEVKVQRITHSHKPGELFFLFELIKRVWMGIERENYLINPTGWRCNPRYCDFYAQCRGRYA